MIGLFLIPARGGSKGLPGKNLAQVGGIPLVGRTARAATRAATVLSGDWRIVCSTDDDEIARVARLWGAEVPFVRPARLSTDAARSVDVVYQALDALGGSFDTVVLLQPTSPFAAAEDIVDAVRLHWATRECVVSVCRAEHPVEWLVRLTPSGLVDPDVASRSERRQDANESWRINGAIYVATPTSLRKQDGFIGHGTRGFEMPADRSIDVDSIHDLHVAQAVASFREVPAFDLGGRLVGPGHPCFVIAEAGVNHNGDLETARRLVDAAADAGADAVKFQTWITEKICRRGAPKAEYQRRGGLGETDQFAMLKRLELPFDWHPELKARAESRGLVFLSTPDDIESAEFLCTLGVGVLKVGSAELTNLPYLTRLARLGKPLIISTGMGSLEGVARAVDAAHSGAAPAVALLHCVSAYPAPEAEMNLRAITTLQTAFDVPIGLSDHTAGHTSAVMGVALGICILEKHLTMDRTMPGPDHAASADPTEFAEMVRTVRRAEAMLGTGVKTIMASERDTARSVERTLVYALSLASGHRVSEEDFEALRCGERGLPPEAAAQIRGKALVRAVERGKVVDVADFQ